VSGDSITKAATWTGALVAGLGLLAAVMVGSGWLAPASKVEAVEARLEARTVEIQKIQVAVGVMGERIEHLRTEQTQLRAEQRAGFDRLAAKLDNMR